jgi:hypothetical protein
MNSRCHHSEGRFPGVYLFYTRQINKYKKYDIAVIQKLLYTTCKFLKYSQYHVYMCMCTYL